MQVAVGRLVLDFYGNDNLAVKHRKLEELCHGLRREFNLSALEVADLDDPERCVLGFAAVIPETWKQQSAENLLEKICKKIDETSIARVMVEDCDILDHGEG